MAEIIAHPTDENLRVRLEIDSSPSQPYNDGGFPIWRIERKRGYTSGVFAQETGITGYVTPADLDDALTRMYSDGWTNKKLERYLRIFWGVTFVDWYDSGSYRYFTCDPAHWREHVGVTDEITRREDYAKGAFDEWQAWCEGTVWYAIPEWRVRRTAKTHTAYPDGTAADDYREYQEWIEHEYGAVGGFYGDVDEDMRINVLWNFGWPAHRCKVCGKGIVNDVHVGWTLSDKPADERGLHTNHGDDGSQHTPEEN